MKDLNNICTSIEFEQKKQSFPVSPEIVQTTSFRFQNYQHYLDVNAGKADMYTYTRGDNPTIAM